MSSSSRSSRECQINDWPAHQVVCKPLHNGKVRIQSSGETTNIYKNDNSIFTDEGNTRKAKKEDRISPVSYPPLVDFSKATKNKQTPITNSTMKPDGNSYLFSNEYYTDIPEVNKMKPTSSINVKCNKVKHKLVVQNGWTGVELYKFMSYSLSVPLEKLKIIHKGRVLSRETIFETVMDKAVYQVIGELAACEDGLDQRDISVMMQQTGLDRNTSVQTLKKKGDLLDALLEQ